MNALASLVEKVVATFLQAFIVAFLAAGSMDLSTAEAAAFAAIPATASALVAALPVVPQDLPFWLDLVWRTVRTFAVGFLGYVAAVPVFTLDPSLLEAAAVAGGMAALAVAKGLLASKIGQPSSAALLPARYDPPPLGA